MYALKVQARFAASHVLTGRAGACARLHGHTWTVAVRVGGETLDQDGMLLDFHDLKEALGRVLETLDHRHLNDLSAFASREPTAENLARHVYREMAAMVPARVLEVEVGESPDSFAYFREGDDF
ncbi:MAG: 6-carboxytetrahydropterin synthase QueD [Peptococcaceae bacterium]|jgi:6-pyruvoyltetrahydropterin/6-carboxytetrahydropterin synthase|nr:6-carboxytetrahydropterin synthase QueD [Peptococcaceae bacterium]